MADSTKLVMTFTGTNGKNLQLSYKYANEEVQNATVNALMNGIIENGAIFATVPAAKKAAKVVITSESEVELS